MDSFAVIYWLFIEWFDEIGAYYFVATEREKSHHDPRVWWGGHRHQRGIWKQDAGCSAGNEGYPWQTTPGSPRGNGTDLRTTG